MELQFYGKNVEITKAISEYAKKKTDKLGRYLSKIDESKLEISRENTKSPSDRFTVQITLRSKGSILRAEERASSINPAIDLATDSLAHQIRRFKARFDRKGKGEPGETATGLITENITTARRSKRPKIVRVKRFVVQSMSPREASEQMELLNHDFFMFLNPETEAMNLIYRRKDGNYGLIEPELGAD